MSDNEKTTIQISKESLVKLREMAEYEKRSTSSQADWIIDRAFEEAFPARNKKTPVLAGK